ncbi:MAG: hypothetical protein ABJ013_16165 [Halioglobus sp.]
MKFIIFLLLCLKLELASASGSDLKEHYESQLVKDVLIIEQEFQRQDRGPESAKYLSCWVIASKSELFQPEANDIYSLLSVTYDLYLSKNLLISATEAQLELFLRLRYAEMSGRIKMYTKLQLAEMNPDEAATAVWAKAGCTSLVTDNPLRRN